MFKNYSYGHRELLLVLENEMDCMRKYIYEAVGTFKG